MYVHYLCNGYCDMGELMSTNKELNTREQNILDAKKSLKSHIRFFESLLDNLKFSQEGSTINKSMWAAWCLHRYIEDRLIGDMEKACEEFGNNVDRTLPDSVQDLISEQIKDE